MTKEEYKRLVIVIGVLVAYVLCMYLIGFLISTVALLYALVTLFSYEKKLPIWKKALFSAAVTGAIWFIFRNLLTVMLPSGILF